MPLLDKIQSWFSRPAALAAQPKPAPKPQPHENDYLWERAKLGASPSRTHYRDLPIISTSGFDDVGTVKHALSQLAQGQFYAAAQMCDAFIGDDRIGALYETRLEALASLPIEVNPSLLSSKKARAQKIAEQVETEWSGWFADAEVKRLHEWGLSLGFGIAELLWDTTKPDYWAPRLKTWDLRHCYWRWDTRSFWMITLDGPVEVRPGDGHWVIYAPHGYSRPWLRGMVRPFALPYMTRSWTQRDWARWCEVHGLPIRVGIVPSQADAPAKESFIRDLLYIGNDAVLRAEQDENGKGFDVKLVEAASQSWQGFRQLLAACDENMAIRMLGQNLTTSVKGGGSYAAANVHDRIRLDRVEADAKSLGACLSEQVVRPWCVYNYGDDTLAPKATWSTKTLVDRDAVAKTLNTAGDALGKLRAGGLNVDREAFAKIFRIPLVAGKPLIDDDDEAEEAAAVPGGLGDSEPEEDAEIVQDPGADPGETDTEEDADAEAADE